MQCYFFRNAIFSFIFISFSAVQAQSAKINLFEAFSLALQKSETPAIQMNETNQARERVKQARGAVLPTVDLSSSYTRQDVSRELKVNPTASEVRTTKLTVSQPIFQGTKEYAAMRVADENVRYNELLFEQSRITLFQSVAQVFFNAVAAEQDLDDLEATIKLLKDRMKQLEQRFRIGRNRKGDVLLAKSAVANLQAQIEGARNAIVQTRLQFFYLTGINESSKLDRNLKAPVQLPELSSYLQAIEKRPDVQAMQSQLKVAQDNAAIAQGGHYPTIGAFGNAYFDRTGALAKSKWDVGVNINIPIYGGGIVSSQVREFALKKSQLELQLQQMLRNNETTIRTLHSGVLSGLVQIASYKDAVKSSEENYHEQVRDFHNGLVSSLDLIQALTTLQDAKQAGDSVFYKTLTQYAQLESSVGRVPQNLP